MINFSINEDLINVYDIMFDFNMKIGIGSSSDISTSKITKIIVVGKNRVENGSRAEFCGSNPHWNGYFFLSGFIIFR